MTDVIHRLSEVGWWDAVHQALDAMSLDEVESYRGDADRLGGVAADGLRGG